MSNQSLEEKLATATSNSSISYTLHIRKPLTPSSMVTFVTTFTLRRLVTAAKVCRAASGSMQGTKKLYPFLNFFQLIRYDTDSIFIGGHLNLQEL